MQNIFARPQPTKKMCFKEIISCHEAIALLRLTHYYSIQWSVLILNFINFYNEIFITLHFHWKSSVEITSLTWLISYICIIVCTSNYFETSVNNIAWIRGMSTFSAIDHKRKNLSKKFQLRVYQTKNFICAFVYLVYISD